MKRKVSFVNCFRTWDKTARMFNLFRIFWFKGENWTEWGIIILNFGVKFDSWQ